MRTIIKVATIVIAVCAEMTVAFAAPSPSLESSQIWQQYHSSVGFVNVVGTLYNNETDEAQGSGFLISDDGDFLTANHVVSALDPVNYKQLDIFVSFDRSDSQPLKATIVAKDSVHDLAVLRVPVKGRRALRIGDSDEVTPGVRVNVLGFPIIASVVAIDDGLIETFAANDFHWITQAPMNPGVSGGPIVDFYGRAVGIAYGGVRTVSIYNNGEKHEIPLENMNLVIPFNFARNGVLKQAKVNLAPNADKNLYSALSITKRYPVSLMSGFGLGELSHQVPAFDAVAGYTVEAAHFIKSASNNVVDATPMILGEGQSVALSTEFAKTSNNEEHAKSGTLKGTLSTVQIKRPQIFTRFYPVGTFNGHRDDLKVEADQDLAQQIFPAEPGYRIVSYQYEAIDGANAEKLNFVMSDDQTKLTTRFHLDRITTPSIGGNRIIGTLVTKQELLKNASP